MSSVSSGLAAIARWTAARGVSYRESGALLDGPPRIRSRVSGNARKQEMEECPRVLFCVPLVDVRIVERDWMRL